jgi:hypothetical protein
MNELHRVCSPLTADEEIAERARAEERAWWVAVLRRWTLYEGSADHRALLHEVAAAIEACEVPGALPLLRHSKPHDGLV